MNLRQRAFLAAFRETGNVRLACKVANVGVVTCHAASRRVNAGSRRRCGRTLGNM